MSVFLMLLLVQAVALARHSDRALEQEEDGGSLEDSTRVEIKGRGWRGKKVTFMGCEVAC